MLAAALAVLIACASGGVPLDQSFKIKVGDTVRVADLGVKFASVPDDSRCPPDVNCIWAGDGVVRLEVLRGKDRKIVDLHTHGPKNAPAFGYEVELRGLTRAPYTAELVVKRGS